MTPRFYLGGMPASTRHLMRAAGWGLAILALNLALNLGGRMLDYRTAREVRVSIARLKAMGEDMERHDAWIRRMEAERAVQAERIRALTLALDRLRADAARTAPRRR